MGLRDDILESLLPTKWSRWIASLSIISGIAVFFLPESLKLLCIKISDSTALLLRISLPLFLWLLGSLLVLAIVVQYCKTLKTQKQPPSPILPPIAKPVQLPKEQIEILLLLLKQGELFIFQITQTLNISEPIIKYHLQELYKNNFILQGLPTKPGRPWHITDKGTKYLIENKLIS